MLLVQLAYDGTDLRGAAALPGVRTVVGEVRAALARCGEADAVVEALSRTDAGVHASGQVVAIDGLRHETRALAGLRRHLPPAIAALAAAAVVTAPVAVEKTYAYVLDLSCAGQPFATRFSWRPPYDVPLAGLHTAAALVPGDRDWRAFARRGETREDLRREIRAVRWRGVGDLAVCEVVGAGFTYRLVRSLVGAMIGVARGAYAEQDLVAALRGDAHPVAQEQAPACGLHLASILLHPEPAWQNRASLWRNPWDPL